jgi:dinuclear metal center YbgI/SA1388 family protein
VRRDELVSWLDAYLEISAFPDSSQNGLQFEGQAEVKKIGAAVDAGIQVFESALAQGVDFLLVHHGLLWGQPFRFTGHRQRRLALLARGELNLYAAHLPLDVHPEVGNAALLAGGLGLRNLVPFGSFDGVNVGWAGELVRPESLGHFAERVARFTNTDCLVHANGVPEIQRVGIVTGSGGAAMGEAQDLGLDLLLTGEPKQAYFHESLDREFNVIYAGHYNTEVFGVRALAQKLAATFGLESVFLDFPTGL